MGIKAHVRLENGKALSVKNIDRIEARSDRVCSNIRHPGIGDDYYEKWVIKRESEGLIFREVTHGMGISGHYSTIRELIIQALSCNGIQLSQHYCFDCPLPECVHITSRCCPIWQYLNKVEVIK